MVGARRAAPIFALARRLTAWQTLTSGLSLACGRRRIAIPWSVASARLIFARAKIGAAPYNFRPYSYPARQDFSRTSLPRPSFTKTVTCYGGFLLGGGVEAPHRLVVIVPVDDVVDGLRRRFFVDPHFGVLGVGPLVEHAHVA